jgi:hypothetical protein
MAAGEGELADTTTAPAAAAELAGAAHEITRMQASDSGPLLLLLLPVLFNVSPPGSGSDRALGIR